MQAVRAAYDACMQEPCERGLGEGNAATGAAAGAKLPGVLKGPPCGPAVGSVGASAPTVQPHGKQQGSPRGLSTVSARHSAAQPAAAAARAPQLPGQKQGAQYGAAATPAGDRQARPAGHSKAAVAALQPPPQRQGSRGGATSAGYNIAGSPINALLALSHSTSTAVAAPAGAQTAGRPHFARPAELEAHARSGMQTSAVRPHACQRQGRDSAGTADARAAGAVQGGTLHGALQHAATQGHRGVSQPVPNMQPTPAHHAVPRAGQPAQLHCHLPQLVASSFVPGGKQGTQAAANMQRGPDAASNPSQAQEPREALPSVAGAVAGMQHAGQPGKGGSGGTPALLQQGALPVLEHRMSAPAAADMQSGMEAEAGRGCPASAQPQRAPASQRALGHGGTELPAAKSASVSRPIAAVRTGESPMRLQGHSTALRAEGHKENLPAAANVQDAAAGSPVDSKDAGASGQLQRAPPVQAHLVPQRRPAGEEAPVGAAKRRRAGTLLTPFSDSDSGDSGVWA